MITTQGLFDLTARDIMSRELMAVPRKMSLPVAAGVLAQAQIGGAPVVGSDGRCIGAVLDSGSRAGRNSKNGRRKGPRPSRGAFARTGRSWNMTGIPYEQNL